MSYVDIEPNEEDPLNRININKKNELYHIKKRKWFLGISCILLVAFIWTLSSIVVQYLFQNNHIGGAFFLTFIGTSLFTINIPIWFITSYKAFNKYEKIIEIKETFYISIIIGPIWFISNYFYNQSLKLTSITSSTTISSTSSIFTFLLSILILKEKFSFYKLLGVSLCMIGNLLIVINDKNNNNNNQFYKSDIFGDFMALIGAILYGLYTTLIKKYIPNHTKSNDSTNISICLLFGFIGLVNMIFLFPVIIIIYIYEMESIHQLNTNTFMLLILKGIFDNVLSDYLWAYTIIWTSPTVATLGLSLTIPMAICSDTILHHISPNVITLLASFIVIIGFILINIATFNNS